MRVITKRSIAIYCERYPLARVALVTLYNEFVGCDLENFNELKEKYRSASIVANNRVVFNIRGNTFRLIVAVNFSMQAAYIIWFGTHAQYDLLDAATVTYTDPQKQ